MSIALHPEHVEEFLAFSRPKREKNEAETGVHAMLSKRKVLSQGATVRGYEVLGYDYGAFHSFAVNYQENEYCGDLGLSLNANGLFDNYSDAVKAAQYTRLPTTGAEPGLWFPWWVSEYDLM